MFHIFPRAANLPDARTDQALGSESLGAAPFDFLGCGFFIRNALRGHYGLSSRERCRTSALFPAFLRAEETLFLREQKPQNQRHQR